MTTTMIRKDFWTVRSGEKAATMRLVKGMWLVGAIDALWHLSFTSRTAALTAATAMVAA